ncbi:MAG: FHA domain-containing protein [Anaerolineae bacterium]|nr:FHA domain-containing protein [Anaerolineae bacterium]
MADRHPEDFPKHDEVGDAPRPPRAGSPPSRPEDRSSSAPGTSQLKETDTGVLVCQHCGHRNPVGTTHCLNCKSPLLTETRGLGTKQYDRMSLEGQQRVTDTGELMQAAVSTAGTSVFTDDMVLRLEIEGAATPILLFPKKETVIGRRDPATGTMPDVDLTSYAGYRMGVSRRHAVIRLRNNEVEIFDLGSSNGTGVNGMRLQPHQPHPLRDGDSIALGKMNIRVLFQLRTRRRSTT